MNYVDKITYLKNLTARVQAGIEKEAQRGNQEAKWLLGHLWK